MPTKFDQPLISPNWNYRASYGSDDIPSANTGRCEDTPDYRNNIYQWKGTQLMMWHPADGWSIVEIDLERK